MTAVPRKEVTTREVASIRFGLLTDDEVRKLSVKQIVSPQTYDAFGTPVPDGLYDAHLGPVDHAGRCGTCGLNHTHCPGHFGHIELPVPVYNPLVFGTLYKLVRHTCLHCHHFKMGRAELAKFSRKLDLIERGELTEAAAISITGHMKGKDVEDYGISSAPEPEAPGGGRARKVLNRGGAAGTGFTSASQEALIECVHSLFARMPKAKCANCGALNPVIKKQGSTKLFRVYTSKKAILQNRLRGVTLDEILAGGQEAGGGEDTVEELEQQVVAEVTEASRKRKRAAAAAAAAAGTAAEGKEQGQGEEGEEDKEGDVLVGKMEGDKSDEEAGWDDEEDEQQAGRGGKRAKSMKRGGLDGEDEPDDDALKARYLPPDVVEDALRKLCKHEADVLRHVYGVELGAGPPAAAVARAAVAAALPGKRRKEGTGGVTDAPRELYRVFFMRSLAVTPNRFRPPSVMGDQKYEHTQNILLQKILNDALNIASTKETLQGGKEAAGTAPVTTPATTTPPVLSPEQRSAELSRFMGTWLRLQNDVNALLDSTTADTSDQTGIRQQLEKKEGLFRKNMMGKRVNFAARSVISPDPYIGAGEIGVPPYFATRLSFPEAVTPWNVERLRAMVARGSHEHPGAVAVEDERGRVVSLEKMSAQRREALSKQLLASGGGHAAPRALKSSAAASAAVPCTPGAPAAGAGGTALLPPAGKGWVVYRHLLDGDIMLTNRQPTLHKPGLMAHKARVLKGERTIRMHYANCATFNADFDGDEINLHLPQDQYGRAEGYGIVHADLQYIVPTDGKPIRGLIQDHVGGGVLLTKRDTFFTRQQAAQLLYVACTAWSAGSSVPQNVTLPPPALLKPRQLWTGKQLLSAVVRHYSAGQPPLSFTAASKVPSDYWGRSNDEGEFVFWKGELMAGCLDKSQFGKFGLVHAVQEVYGDAAAGALLSALSRLLTNYLQWVGFTCGLDDLLLRPPSETARSSILAGAETAALAASADMVGRVLPKALNPALNSEAEEEGQERERVLGGVSVGVAKALAGRYRANRDVAGAMHDMKVTGAMHPLSSEVIRACIPSGQVKPFPANCMSLMTVSGAKGSLVNFSQISCLLGQQELEGRRVPRMASGKTLPCFRPFDGGARSGGFVGDRFLSGLRPQEYYFHCMAGREGLVDTTVKTSRSGYLQRCLVKNLEALKVEYDYSVRDACDGSVVQLFYGEDGLDVTKVSYLRQFPFMAANAAAEAASMGHDPRALMQLGGAEAGAPAGSPAAAVEAALKRRHKLRREASNSSANSSGSQAEAAGKLAQLPTLMEASWPSALGATSEAFADAVEAFVESGAGGLIAKGSAGGGEGKKSRRKSKGGVKASGGGGMDAAAFTRLMQLKYQRALAAPGEAVGVLAAQSIGEPSTQMTLNTFHMAGRGEANVTLGIPRLREILMTAASKIKTPTMTIPLRPGSTASDAASLAKRMRKLKLAECLAGISVTESPVARLDSEQGAYGRLYAVKLQFHQPHKYPKEADVTFEQLSKVFTTSFCKQLKAEVARATKRSAGSVQIGKIDLNVLTRAEGEDEEEGDEAAAAVGGGALVGGDAGEDGEGGEPGGSSRAVKKASEKGEQYEDFEENEELREGKLRFRGGREEAATYEGPDAGEAAAAKAAERAARQRSGEESDEDDADQQQQGQGQQKEEEEEEEQDAAGVTGRGGAGASTSGRGSKGGGKKGKKGEESGEGGELVRAGVDAESYTCEVQVVLPLSAPKLIMLQLVERVAAATVVRCIPGVEKVHVLDPERGSSSGSSGSEAVPRLQTEGLNLQGAWEHKQWLDVDKIVTNDVHAMLMAYGVEAARATILREAQAVFGAYGIGVDVRHLSLIADFMTHAGGYRACNRIGIESSTSPLLKMSFETAAKFLTEAALRGEVDALRTPAARLAVGGVAEVGTGCCAVLQTL